MFLPYSTVLKFTLHGVYEEKHEDSVKQGFSILTIW